MSRQNSIELLLYKILGRLLPRVPHASGVINRLLKPIYNRRSRDLSIADVMGKLMELDPSEDVDANLLFCPQLYDFKEMGFISEILNNDDCFVDVGAHIGFYSLMVSKYIHLGEIVSIEADPGTYERLNRNISLNVVENISTVNCGVSDKKEQLNLGLHLHGNKGGQSFLGDKSDGVITIDCVPLLNLIKETGLTKIKLMKLDIEGFEYKVLSKFFSDADKELYPKYIITEYFGEENVSKTTGNQIELMESYGYLQIKKCRDNRILKFCS